MGKTLSVYENVKREFKVFSQAQGKGRTSSKLLEGFNVEMEKIF